MAELQEVIDLIDQRLFAKLRKWRGEFGEVDESEILRIRRHVGNEVRRASSDEARLNREQAAFEPELRRKPGDATVRRFATHAPEAC